MNLELAKLEAKNFAAQRKMQITTIISNARKEALYKAKQTASGTHEDVLVLAEKYYQFLIKDLDLEY